MKNTTRDHFEGLIDGIKMYAWWKDGTQYVGTTGTTLKEAIKRLEDEYTIIDDCDKYEFH